MIRRAVQRSEWVRVHKGIYRLAGYQQSWNQHVLSRCLLRPDNAWASHTSAAAIHGLAGGKRDPVELTVTCDLRLPACRVHLSPSLPACDQTKLGPVPVTRVERTLIDLAGTLDDETLEDALDDALISRTTTSRNVLWRLDRMGTQGRKGAGRLKSLAILRLEDSSVVDSRLERRFTRAVKRANLPRPVLHHPVKLPDGSMRYPDFSYPDRKLIVEVVGYRYHGGRRKWEKDLIRSSDLGALGWRILYITRDQLRNHERETMQRLRRALGITALF